MSDKRPRTVSDLYVETIKFAAWGALCLSSYLLVDRYQEIARVLGQVPDLDKRISRIEAVLERK